MITLLFPAIIMWAVYHKTHKWGMALFVGALTFCLVDALAKNFETFACANFMGAEQLESQRSPPIEFGAIATPTMQGQHIQSVENTQHGDNTLTNLYRRLHNLDAIQRTEVFQFNDSLAGGSYGIPMQPYIAEANERAMMDLKEQIRQEIASRRRPFSEAYDIPTKPLMGTFDECYLNGDCQAQADAEGKFLGLPSQVGLVHGYY